MNVSYVQNGMSEEAVEVFYDMRVEGIEPTRLTVSSFLSASANIGALEEGKQGHAIAVLGGLELDNILGTSIINFYFKVGLIDDAELVFSRMLEKDVVTTNENGRYLRVDKALNIRQLMRSENLRFDAMTLASLLSASADISNMKLGKEGHCYCIRNNLESDVVVMQLEGMPPNAISWNSVILGFLRSGQVNEARDMFLQLRSLGVQLDWISWTTLISGLAQNGFQDKAILVFQQMQEAGITPDTTKPFFYTLSLH
ncbi:pentatricopeptide repeat-containing protein At5g55740, chloroplastic-like [Castanea sativa]|uniref:pentatricopeptide repeat-containing protein At5g55740, chloroplastic-like n=1 Tax=Castanea sativa TaxID=21020 RepID=UPI003F64C963